MAIIGDLIDPERLLRQLYGNDVLLRRKRVPDPQVQAVYGSLLKRLPKKRQRTHRRHRIERQRSR